MSEVYPDIQGINAVKQKHALNTRLFRLRQDVEHMERVLKADNELLARCRERRDRHEAQLHKLKVEERKLERRAQEAGGDTGSVAGEVDSLTL